MSQASQTIDATVSAAASKVTGAGSAVTLVSWINASDFGIYIGILIGVAGLVVNWYFKHRNDKRNAEAHAAFMHKMSFDSHATVAELRAESGMQEFDE